MYALNQTTLVPLEIAHKSIFLHYHVYNMIQVIASASAPPVINDLQFR